MNTYPGNIKYKAQQKKSQNQLALFTNQVPALIGPPYVLSTIVWFVMAYLHYCASVWGSTYQSNVKRLINLQKRVISKNNFQEFF